MRSFRARLALRFTALFALAFVLVGIVTLVLLRHVLTAQLDGTLLRLTAIEASAASDAPDSGVHFHEGIFNGPHGTTPMEVARYAEIWRTDGSPLVRSRSLGARDLPVALEAFAAARHGEIVTLTVTWDGEPLRTVYYPLKLLGPAHRSHILQIAASLQPIRDVLKTFVQFFLAVGLVTLALAFVGGWLLATHAVRPTLEITAQAEAITAGSLAARIAAHTDTAEYGRLVAVLNAMLKRLEDAFEAQRRFIADASHEIRHPLAVLRAGLDLARRRDRTPPEYQSAIEIGIAHVDRVTQLAEGLLLLARADAGVLNPRLESVDLGMLVEQACARAALLAQERGVAVAVDACSVFLPLDAALIGRVLNNLLDNAVTLSQPGQVVLARLERVDVAPNRVVARVHVVDAGPGVALEHRRRLFERFFRGDAARATQGGAGLGLAIALGIAEAHGGTVTYSPSEPKGSRFTLTLPV